MDTKDYVIAKTSEGRVIYWQGRCWWGRCLADAQGFSEEEARRHEDGFNNAGVHKVFVETRTVK